MHLLEAMIEANHRAIGGDKSAGLHPEQFADSLPLVALTCIDVRLNPLMPEVLGIPEEHFIWLRNAGNIITSPSSSTMRSLALACAIKGGREIAIIGHTDCRVRQISGMDLTDRFKNLGVPRAQLPENLQEFFGLFASEQQNVIRAAQLARESPLIGPKVPVHGLLVDIQSGRLEWLVNGYNTLPVAGTQTTHATTAAGQAGEPLSALQPFQIGELRFPEVKIGETVVRPILSVSAETQHHHEDTPENQSPKAESKFVLKLDPDAIFKVVGDDRKVYGPVTGRDIERWILEKRIDVNSLAQKLGYKEWKPLAEFLHKPAPPKIPLAGGFTSALRKLKGKSG